MHVSQWDTCCSLRDVQTAAAHRHPIKQQTLVKSSYHSVLYEKKGPGGPVTLHTIKDMVHVYTVEKLEVHPHAKNFWPQVCVTKPGSRQTQIPGQKYVKQTASRTLMSCTSTTCHVYCAACRCLLMFKHVQGYKIMFVKQKAPMQKSI